MADLVINGASMALQYKRTTPRSIDSTDTWETLAQAKQYAKNTDNTAYVPYNGQVISVLENGKVYKLSPDNTISTSDGRQHYKLEEITSTNFNDDLYIKRDEAAQINHLWTFLKGINVNGLATLEQVKILKDIISGNFVVGSSGFGIYQDEQGNYHLDIDNVDVRKRLNVQDLRVEQSNYIGGKEILTVGGGIICTEVKDLGSSYRCFFKTEDADGRIIYNKFIVGDNAICQTFNLKNNNQYYWRAVTGVGDNYIDLSKTDCVSGSTVPKAGDEICHLGNKSNAERQGAIINDTITTGGPYIRVYSGISGFTLPEPIIDFNPNLSVVKAKLINQATGNDINDEMNQLRLDFGAVREQVDKEFTIWFYEYAPTMNNKPAVDWTSQELLELHEQDIFYDRSSGLVYRFEWDESMQEYRWNQINDVETIRALEKADKAQDTADSKRRVFLSQPTTDSVYDIGDQWLNAEYYENGVAIYVNDSLVCIKGKKKGEAFSIDHWQPSSTATTAYVENLGNQIIAAVTDSERGIQAAKDLANQGIADAANAAEEAAKALGIANDANGKADENTAVISVMNDTIAALVEGIHYDEKGNITNISTSGLVTTDDFSTLLAKEVKFDADGNVTNINTSGFVTESNFSSMFSQEADENGVITEANISTYIEDGISKATISADQISFEGTDVKISAENIDFIGKTIINDNFKVDEQGNLTLDHITANNGTFNGTVNATDGSFKGHVEATSGSFTGEVNATSGRFEGEVIATSGSFTGKVYASEGSFTGTVNATDGLFNGEVNASSGTFNGTVNATDGVFNGTVNATDGTFNGVVNATSGVFNDVQITGSIRTRWKTLQYKPIYTSASIDVWGFDGTAIEDDRIILEALTGAELLISWGDDADGRDLIIFNKITTKGATVSIKIPNGQSIVGSDGTTYIEGQSMSLYAGYMYRMVGMDDMWVVLQEIKVQG